MDQKLADALRHVNETLDTAEKYEHACHVLNYDLETLCPEEAMERQGETIAFLSNEAYKCLKEPSYIEDAEYLYGRRDDPSLCGEDRALAVYLHEDYGKVRNISPEENLAFQRILNQAYVDWIAAKNASDYALFKPSLEKVLWVNKTDAAKRDVRGETDYETLLGDYEKGITIADLDDVFGRCKERLLPFLEKIKKSGKTIRTDFLTRQASDEQQRIFAEYLLNVINYDFTRGAFTTTEHPFTDDLAPDDVRVTTHYRSDISSNMYSIIHEGGHALFGQLQPASHHAHHIANRMTMGMHESVSRFYENRIGRSEAFISLIYPKMKEIFPASLTDVTERELYEAVNTVTPSLIRTEADEFTYTLHVIIRYEIEKMIVNEGLSLEKVPEIWNRKYEEYLGVRPASDAEGVLQDVHWSSGFGYFPAYALGNMYNAMYCNRMREDLDAEACVRRGDFAQLNGWMKEHVFRRANLLAPKEWIAEITGRALTPDDFLTYLEEKYGDLYGL